MVFDVLYKALSGIRSQSEALSMIADNIQYNTSAEYNGSVYKTRTSLDNEGRLPGDSGNLNTLSEASDTHTTEIPLIGISGEYIYAKL